MNVIRMEKQEINKKEQKLPMFYEQVNNLMKAMSNCYSKGMGFKYHLFFKQLYSRVRNDLSDDRKNFFDDKIKEIWLKNSPKGQSYDPEYRIRRTRILHSTYELEIELFQDLENNGVFKVLKQNLNDMELM
jgi:hypothetical protein